MKVVGGSRDQWYLCCEEKIRVTKKTAGHQDRTAGSQNRTGDGVCEQIQVKGRTGTGGSDIREIQPDEVNRRTRRHERLSKGLIWLHLYGHVRRIEVVRPRLLIIHE